jgi:hypothetical protein
MVDRSENELDEAKISIVRGIVIFSIRATVIAITVSAGQCGTRLKLTPRETGISG